MCFWHFGLRIAKKQCVFLDVRCIFLDFRVFLTLLDPVVLKTRVFFWILFGRSLDFRVFLTLRDYVLLENVCTFNNL